MEQQFVKVKEASKIFGCSGVTIRRWIKAGLLDSVKLNQGYHLIPKSSIAKMLEKSSRHLNLERRCFD